MDLEDLFELGHAAIPKVAGIAAQVGVAKRNPKCGQLGAQLLVVAGCLRSTGVERLRSKIAKLLWDIERICSVSLQRNPANLLQNRPTLPRCLIGRAPKAYKRAVAPKTAEWSLSSVGSHRGIIGSKRATGQSISGDPSGTGGHCPRFRRH